jgi:hypothetical protein
MTLRAFIAANRSEIDAAITGRVPRTASCYCGLSGTDHQHQPSRLNDEERRLWVLNDEGLYRWARSEGVRI